MVKFLGRGIEKVGLSQDAVHEAIANWNIENMEGISKGHVKR